MPSLPLRRCCVAVLAVAAVALAGCSLVFDTEQVQCETADDCAARGLAGACVDHVCVEAQGTGGQGGGGGADVRWGCLGQVDWPEPQLGTMVTLRTQFEMASAGAPIPDDIVVHFCSALDIDCTAPIAGPIPMPSDGLLTVQVESGTRGYYQLGGPSIMPTLLYLSRPAQAEPTPIEDDRVTLVTPAFYQSLIGAVGFPDDPTRGTLLTITIDCEGRPAAGVGISSPEVDTSSTPFYFVNQIPSPNTTQTDVSGYAGIIYMPPGTGTVEAHLVADDRWIGVSSFQIRPGTLTNVAIEPTPVQ